MKKENNISTLEETYRLVRATPMTEAEMIETRAILKNSFYKEKYRNGLKSLTKGKMKRLEMEYPELELKDMLIAIIKDYTPKLPTPILLEMIQFIIAEWEHSHAHQEEPVLVEI
jgi:predicted metal-dependent hydrolase